MHGTASHYADVQHMTDLGIRPFDTLQPMLQRKLRHCLLEGQEGVCREIRESRPAIQYRPIPLLVPLLNKEGAGSVQAASFDDSKHAENCALQTVFPCLDHGCPPQQSKTLVQNFLQTVHCSLREAQSMQSTHM